MRGEAAELVCWRSRTGENPKHFPYIFSQLSLVNSSSKCNFDVCWIASTLWVENTEPGAVATGFMMEWLSALVIEVVQVLISHREAIQLANM